MRRSVLLGLAVAAALCSNCRSSEPGVSLRASHQVLGTQIGPAVSAPQQCTASDPAFSSPWPDVSLTATATEHFVIFHPPQADYVAAAGQALEYAYQHFYEAFSRAGFDPSHSGDRLMWLCFPRKSDFSRYALQVEGMDLSWLDAYYSTLTNRVAVVQADRETSRCEEAARPLTYDVRSVAAAGQPPYESGGSFSPPLASAGPGPTSTADLDVTRLTHEVAHQLAFNSGIQRRSVIYPLWVSEGLATNFEFTGSIEAGLEHCNRARCNGLLEAYAAGRLTSLRQFVVQVTVPPDAQAGRQYYAQAWGFFRFLLTERPEDLRTYLALLAQEGRERPDVRTMLREFTQAFGAPETLEPAWRAFLTSEARQSLAEHWAPAGADRATIPQS